MKNLFAILGLITAAGIGTGIFFWMRRPKLVATPNYENKTVTYELSAGGEKLSGTKDFKDKTTTQKESGDWKFLVSAEGPGFVLAIFKNGVVTEAIQIDLDKKSIVQLGNGNAG